ncbi:MAG: hypothetical protein C4530_24750 [Desulfobacteraceae bacterium]|nr:MAG: hypothetical protein C4530_24750 [Desulfobacteraceae bacterium]
MLAQSALSGGHVRIGMEDNLYLEKGNRALNNKELVAKAVRILDALGKKPASVDKAKHSLNIK